MRWLALLLILAGCARDVRTSTDAPTMLVAIDHRINALPYIEISDKGSWPMPVDKGNCLVLASWKYLELKRAGFDPKIIVYQMPHGPAHAIVRVDGWILDSDPNDGPSPRPWVAPAQGFWVSDLTVMATWNRQRWAER